MLIPNISDPISDAFTHIYFNRPSTVSIETMHSTRSSDFLSPILITKFEGSEHEPY